MPVSSVSGRVSFRPDVFLRVYGQNTAGLCAVNRLYHFPGLCPPTQLFLPRSIFPPFQGNRVYPKPDAERSLLSRIPICAFLRSRRQTESVMLTIRPGICNAIRTAFQRREAPSLLFRVFPLSPGNRRMWVYPVLQRSAYDEEPI